jgi:hypothetical protein
VSQSQFPLPGPLKDWCEGDRDRCTGEVCPVFGRLQKPSRDGRRRVFGCDDPTSRGKRNKRKGQRKQSRAVTALGVPRSPLRPGHEEFLGGTVRVEVKAGKQVGPIDTRFRAYEAQSEAARAFGDIRPFAAVVMPDGTSDGIVLVRLSKVYDFAEAIVAQLGMAG